MLKEFAFDSVQVTAPYFVNAFEKVTQYLLSLDPDRLLAGFRAVSEGKDPGPKKVSNFMVAGRIAGACSGVILWATI